MVAVSPENRWISSEVMVVLLLMSSFLGLSIQGERSNLKEVQGKSAQREHDAGHAGHACRARKYQRVRR